MFDEADDVRVLKRFEQAHLVVEDALEQGELGGRHVVLLDNLDREELLRADVLAKLNPKDYFREMSALAMLTSSGYLCRLSSVVCSS